MTYDVMKRRRIGNDQVPILKVPKDSTVANVQELSMRKDDLGSLLPFRSQWSGSLGSSTVQLLLSGACGLKQVTLDSHGIMFEVYDHGFMCIGCNIAVFLFSFSNILLDHTLYVDVHVNLLISSRMHFVRFGCLGDDGFWI